MSTTNPLLISKPMLLKPSIELMLLRSSWVTISSITLPLSVVLTVAFCKLARMSLVTGSMMDTAVKLIGDIMVYSSNVSSKDPVFKSKSNEITSGPDVSLTTVSAG